MINSPLRILFLTRYPVLGASSRYRVFQYVPYLQSLGVICTVQSFMDEEMYLLSASRGSLLAKVTVTLKAYIRRLLVLKKWREYDIVYMQRELFPFGPPIIEHWLKSRGAVLFFDYDDALFIKKSSRYTPLATFLRSSKKTLQLFKLTDCVVAGNDWLRDQALNYCNHAFTIEVAEDTTRIPMHAHHTNDKPITIGWLGSPSTVKYLNLIAPVLREVAKKFPQLKFEIMGGGDFFMEDVPWRLSEWSLDEELKALSRFDIGLMPLPMEDWSKGKSGGKARTYMAAGIVPVCSAIGYNVQLIKDGETGYLCANQNEWKSKIIRLIEDAELRQRLAVAGRLDVEQRFCPQKQAEKLFSLFQRFRPHKKV